MSALAKDATSITDCSSSWSFPDEYEKSTTGSITSEESLSDPKVLNLKDCANIHIGPMYKGVNARSSTPSVGSHSSQTGISEKIKLPPRRLMQTLLRSQREVELQDLDAICVHVGHSWRELGRLMSYTNGQLDNLDADSPRLSDKTFTLLSLWRDRESYQATISGLTKLLVTAKLYDAVSYLRP